MLHKGLSVDVDEVCPGGKDRWLMNVDDEHDENSRRFFDTRFVSEHRHCIELAYKKRIDPYQCLPNSIYFNEVENDMSEYSFREHMEHK